MPPERRQEIKARLEAMPPERWKQINDLLDAVLAQPPQNRSAYPTTKRIFEACMQVPAFFDARPQAQPDFPEEMKG